MTDDASLSLEVRKVVRAPRTAVYAAWIETPHLMEWWGPRDTMCIAAVIVPHVGGGYRIGNQLPDDTVLWISGTFEEVEQDRRLVFTWRVEGRGADPERVRVEFFDHNGGAATEIVVTHTRIGDEDVKASHEIGWTGCLDGLAKYLEK